MRLLCLALAATLLSGSVVYARTPQRPQYSGRALPEVIRELQSQGLNIVYSSELVRPEMRVTAEPEATAPRRILEEVLEPHGLRIVAGRKNTLLVVWSRNTARSVAPAPLKTGTIRFVVTDKRTGVPLSGVIVNVQGLSLSTTTGAEGEFRIPNVPAEPQFLYVSLVGYGLARPVVNVEPGLDTEVQVALADGVGTFSEEVTVIADPFRALEPAAPSLQTLTSADFQDLSGVLADDPQRAVQTLPGVAAGDDFRSEFSVRASPFRHIGLSVDDIPAGWLVHTARGLQDTGSISILNGDAVESGTLLSGPYAQRRPGRLGAWMSYDLREGSRIATQGHLSVSGTASSYSMNGPIGSRRRGSWTASVRQSYLDWLIRRLDPEADTAFGFTDVSGKLVYDVAPRHQIQFLTLSGRSKVAESRDAPGPNSLDTAIARTGLAALTWRATFRRALLTQRLAFRAEDFHNRGHFGQELGKGHESSLSYLADGIVEYGGGISWRSGVGVQRADVAQTLRQFGFSAPGATSIRGADAIAQSAWTSNAYSGLAWQNARGAAMEAGVGVASSSAIAKSPVSGWGLGAYPIGRGFTLRAGTSLAWQFPDPAQLARPTASAPLRPERAISIDAGIEKRIGSDIRLQVTLFSRTERDLFRLDGAEPRLVGSTIVRTDLVPLWRNALSGVSRGVEVAVQRRGGKLSGWLGYSFGRARQTDGATGEQFWSDFDQRHTLNIYAQYRATPKTTLIGKLRVGSNFPLTGYFTRSGDTLMLSDVRNEERLPVYSRLDLRVNHTFTYTERRLTLFAEVLNVLGRTNLGPTDGTVRTNGTLSGFTEKLIPFVPSLGFIFDF